LAQASRPVAIRLWPHHFHARGRAVCTMVLVEEIEEDEVPNLLAKENRAPAEANENAKADGLKMKKGFLEKAEPLYPPEGSSEGAVSADTHKAHSEHKMNEDMRKGMNRGAEDNNGHSRPEWYTKEWPKDCQYNAPGCDLAHLEASGHASDLHRQMVQGERFKEALAPGVKCIRVNFSQATDEDLAQVIERLKGNTDVTELDVSHNHIKDAGVQRLVGALAGGAAPNLKELRIYNNDFTDLGKVMLTQGLPVLRKKLEIVWEEPGWMKTARDSAKASKAAVNLDVAD